MTEREATLASAPERPLPGPTIHLARAARWIAIPLAGAAVLAILLIPAGWWSAASTPLRSILEALPFGDAVATEPFQRGNPVLVSLVAAVVVGLAIWGVSRWRIRSVRNYLYGGNTFVQIFTVGLIRTVVIFGGIALVPVLGAIADGVDLRDDPDYTFTGPIPPLIVIACWIVFTYVDLRRVYAREAGRPPLRTASGTQRPARPAGRGSGAAPPRSQTPARRSTRAGAEEG